MQRRCSLSCQGCHVNPNGGGIRNQYGVWVQERWLRSFVVPGIGKRNVAPLQRQLYAKQPRGGFKANRKRAMKIMSKKRYDEIISRRGPRLVSTNEWQKERDHDNDDGAYRYTAKTNSEFMERLTIDDPLRIERRRRITGGGDLRYIYLADQSPDLPEGAETTKAWLMTADLGLRLRPIPRKFSFVVENRYLQGPNKSNEQLFTSGSIVRSAYGLIDDLPFNTFFMYGLYRPYSATTL